MSLPPEIDFLCVKPHKKNVGVSFYCNIKVYVAYDGLPKDNTV